MPYTNRHNLPFEVVSALTKNRYSGSTAERASDYSITQLIQPVQQTILKQRYPDCGDGDVIDNLWSMFGSIAHTLLEEHGSEDSIAEQRFYAKVLGKTISGGVDHIKDNQITDYKVTSVWKVMKGNYTEWEQQLNCYAWLCRQSAFADLNIRIIAILRDWFEADCYKPGYPEAPIQIIQLRLWTNKECEEFITSRVKSLIDAETMYDFQLPECTEEEMWSEPDKYAVMPEIDAKRATRVFDSEQEAKDYIIDKKKGILVKRSGIRKRCSRYCIVKNQCNQYQKFLEEQNGKESDQPADLF